MSNDNHLNIPSSTTATPPTSPDTQHVNLFDDIENSAHHLMQGLVTTVHKAGDEIGNILSHLHLSPHDASKVENAIVHADHAIINALIQGLKKLNIPPKLISRLEEFNEEELKTLHKFFQSHTEQPNTDKTNVSAEQPIVSNATADHTAPAVTTTTTEVEAAALDITHNADTNVSTDHVVPAITTTTTEEEVSDTTAQPNSIEEVATTGDTTAPTDVEIA